MGHQLVLMPYCFAETIDQFPYCILSVWTSTTGKGLGVRPNWIFPIVFFFSWAANTCNSALKEPDQQTDNESPRKCWCTNCGCTKAGESFRSSDPWGLLFSSAGAGEKHNLEFHLQRGTESPNTRKTTFKANTDKPTFLFASASRLRLIVWKQVSPHSAYRFRASLSYFSIGNRGAGSSRPALPGLTAAPPDGSTSRCSPHPFFRVPFLGSSVYYAKWLSGGQEDVIGWLNYGPIFASVNRIAFWL